MSTLRTLIIDDESAAREEVNWLLRAHPGVTVVGESATFNQAREKLQSADYDLVLLDIQLIGGTGFDLVPFVRSGANIIFITAYDQFALRAFEVNALDYLLKPLSAARFAAALARVVVATPAKIVAEIEPTDPRAVDLNLTDQVLVKLDSSTDKFIRLDEISSISASQNYTQVVLDSGEKLFVRRTMKAWEDMLPPDAFGRVHRTVIVALGQIERIVRHSRVSFELYLRGQTDAFPVSYRLVPDIRQRLGTRWPQE